MKFTTKAVLGSAVLIGLGVSIALGATDAGAAPAGRNITASTHIAGVPDTTVGGPGNTNVYEDQFGQMTTDPNLSVFGPVWAVDDITNTFKITPLGHDDYKVDRLVNGTFEGLVQPNTGLTNTVVPLNHEVNGQMHGTNSYQVHSVQGPIAANLPAEEFLPTSGNDFPGTKFQLRQLFGQDAAITGGDTWVFAYTADGAGSRMVQNYLTSPTTWGNITG